MRQFLFCLIFFTGLYWVIDVVAFEGHNSAGAWQEAQQFGHKIYYLIANNIDDLIRQIWR